MVKMRMHADGSLELLAMATLLFFPGTGRAEVYFADLGPVRGIGPYTMAAGMAGGVAAADYDDDGDIDLFVPNGHGVSDQLYRNLGGGAFEEIAGSVGLASVARSRAALWLDVDGDGALDLVVARDGWHAQDVPVPTLKLYRQQATGTFEDITDAAGLNTDLLDADATHIGGLGAGDISGDGALDLCVTQWDGSMHLFLNDGQGRFDDISVCSGVDASLPMQWQPVMHDFDRDGHVDIFVAVDYGANHLWINQGDNTFVDEAAAAGVASAWNEMGVSLGDYDNDGDFDLYVTNITRDGRHNRLYRNDTAQGALAFVDVSVELAVDDTFWGWGVAFLDADRDGWLDIAATNGFEAAGWYDDPSRFFQNPGAPGQPFAELSDTVGFNDTHLGSSLVPVDTDRDGDLDLVQTCGLGGPLRLLENVITGPCADNSYLVVRPRMGGPNARAIGAIVRVVADGHSMMQLITAGTSLMGQTPAEAFFGLGAATSVDLVRVEWPDGRATELTDVPVNQVLTVTDGGARPHSAPRSGAMVQPCPFGCPDFDGDGEVALTDLLVVLVAWGACLADDGGGDCVADLDHDGTVGTADLILLLGAWGPCS